MNRNNKYRILQIAIMISGFILGFSIMGLLQNIEGYNYQDRILFHYWALQNTDPLDYYILDEMDNTENQSEYQNRFDLVK